MNRIVLGGAALIAASLLAQRVEASCLNAKSNERLLTRCLIEEARAGVLPVGAAGLLDSRLKTSGYDRGIGLPGSIDRATFAFSLSPRVSYSSNVNGGNPDKPLALGSLVFKGDPELRKRGGFLGGAEATGGGRFLYGEGRYYDYSASASYEYSPLNDVTVRRLAGALCSRNHIKNWWYVDACGRVSDIEKEFSGDTEAVASVDVVKIFASPAGQHQVSFDFRQVYTPDYEQDQASIAFETVQKRGFFISLAAGFGEPVENELAVRSFASVTLVASAGGRPVSFSAQHSFADGGLLFGFEREDETWALALSYAVTDRIGVGASYLFTDSSIDYFDRSEPSLTLQFSPLRF